MLLLVSHDQWKQLNRNSETVQSYQITPCCLEWLAGHCTNQMSVHCIQIELAWQLISVCLPAPQDSFPGCTSPPVAVTWQCWAAPWLTRHTSAGGRRSETHGTFKPNIKSPRKQGDGAHTLSRAMCVSCSNLWQRVWAVWMLHCSLSSHTAWPSNTAFQWWLEVNTHVKSITHTVWPTE